MSPPPQLPAAVLVDMDGLLVDTEPTWFEVECAVTARLGGVWTPEHQHELLGGSLPLAAGRMIEVAGAHDADSPTVQRWLLEGMAERLDAQPPRLMPGAVELLDLLRTHRLPAALVSSSYRVLVDTVLRGIKAVAGELPFTATVAGDEVRHRKPHPEPYRTAAGLLGAEVGRCVVIEDSPAGAESGQSAGCAVLAVPGEVPIPPAPRRHVAGSLLEVDLALLAGLAWATDDAADHG